MEEIWVNITESDKYQVSNLLRVRSFMVKDGEPPRILNTFISKTGYYVVNLSLNKKRRTRKLHRLFAIAFIPNPNNYPEINHIDGNKLNNSINNLEWCTGLMNKRHAFRTGLIPKVVGQNQSSTKLTDDVVIEIFNSKEPTSVLKNKYGVSASAINGVRDGKSWGWLTGKHYRKVREQRKFSDDQVLEIFNSLDSVADISLKYGASYSSIRAIKSGMVHSDVTGKSYNPKMKLSLSQIVEIQKSKDTNAILAKRYNVHICTISNIKNEKFKYNSRN